MLIVRGSGLALGTALPTSGGLTCECGRSVRGGGLTLGTALPTSGGLTCECGRSVRGGGLILRTAWSASVDGAPVSSF